MNRIFTLLLAMALISPAGTRAATSGRDDQSPAVAVLDEVVVTATKTEEKRKDIPNTMVVKDAEDIAEAPAESLGAVLANEPGIDWRTYGNYGGAAEEIDIRGMRGDGTLVVMDGVVLNSPSLGIADISQIPLNSIARVEVDEGPGSLLYGSGASGGTVNIITKEPSRAGYVAKAEAGYGSEETYRLAAESGGFVIGDFGYYLTANRMKTDGFRANSDLTHNDVNLNLLYDKGARFRTSLNFGYVDRKYGLPGVQPPEGTKPFFSSVTGVELYDGEAASLLDRGEDENRHSSLTLKGQATDWLDWRVKGDCAVLKSYNLTLGSNPLTYAFDGAGTESNVTNTVRGLEGNLNLRPLAGARLLVGTEYRNYDYQNQQQVLDAYGQPVAGVSLDLDEDHQVFTQGTFAELSYRPVSLVKFLTGVRYESHSMFGHEWVGRYGVVANPGPETVIKFNHGQHFKAPTMNDLFWPDDGAYTKGNPDLKPETGWHTDVGIEQGMLEGKVLASLTWFNWNIADKIAWAEDPSQPSPTGFGYYWTPSNVDTYKARGWEAGLKIGPYLATRADLSLTLLDAREEPGPGVTRSALYSPDTQFKFQLSHLSDFGLTSTVVARYTSSRPGYYASNNDSAPQIVLASYWTVDLKLEQVLAEHWHLTFLATNLLDKGYDTYLAGFTDENTYNYSQQPYPGAGRSFFASVGYSW